MQKVIKIGDQDVAFRATAATPYRYKQCFHEDFFVAITDKNATEAELADATTKLAYIMAMTAADADMATLNTETFIGWLDSFGSAEFQAALGEIMQVYSGSSAELSKSKKDRGRPTGR